MSNIPADLRYAKSHEWLKVAADGTALVGITDYAQNSLGDITFAQLPKVGATLKAGETFVSGGFFAPTGTVAGDPNFVVTGSVPVVGDADTAAVTGETPTGWKITVVRNDDTLGLITAYALCAKK